MLLKQTKPKLFPASNEYPEDVLPSDGPRHFLLLVKVTYVLLTSVALSEGTKV